MKNLILLSICGLMVTLSCLRQEKRRPQTTIEVDTVMMPHVSDVQKYKDSLAIIKHERDVLGSALEEMAQNSTYRSDFIRGVLDEK